MSKSKLGIDVSEWQGKIDWEKVAAAGVKFAIIRCGYGKNYESQDDDYFARNVAECERLGIPYGVYLYSYATTVAAAKSEAAHVLRLLGNKQPQYPVYYDLEDANTTGTLSNAAILEIAKAWTEEIEAAGFTAGIYANLYWNEKKLNDSWYNTKSRWIAQYNSKCEYGGKYDIWQYSSKGRVNGVAGNCDMNYCYVDFTEAEEETAPERTVDELAAEVIAGVWGNGTTRREQLEAAGYDYEAVQNRVNELLRDKEEAAHDALILQIAKKVIRGDYGNGNERKRRLTAAGYDYDEVQERVNELLRN